MYKRSIVTRIAVLTSGVVSLLLLLGGFVMMKFEKGMTEMFTKEYQEKLSQAIISQSLGIVIIILVLIGCLSYCIRDFPKNKIPG